MSVCMYIVALMLLSFPCGLDMVWALLKTMLTASSGLAEVMCEGSVPRWFLFHRRCQSNELLVVDRMCVISYD